MISTFFSLEAAKRGLMAHMAALDVTGQNISNANTEGYTRQQAILTNLGPLGPAGGQAHEAIGRGVTVQIVEQVKDKYLESEILKQSAVAGFWEGREDLLNRIETLLLEPGDSGVRSLADKFWQSVEDLANYPDDPSHRSAVVQAGVAFVNGVRYIEDQLTFLAQNLDDQIREKVAMVNSNIQAIAQMNDEMRRFETDSVKLNDLRDARDRLVKQIGTAFDVVQMDADGVDGARLMLDGRVLVDGRMSYPLTYEKGLGNSIYPELKFGNDKKGFTTDASVANGRATPRAKEGTHVVEVRRLATAMTIENPALVNAIGRKDYLSDIRGVTSGSVVVNDVEILVDPTQTTLEGFAQILSESGAGVVARVNEVGRLILTAAQTGDGVTINLSDGSSNLFSKMGLVAEKTGLATPPIVDEFASLNIGGWFRVNGKTVTIQQGKNDSLARIAEELNSGVPELSASVVTDAQGLKQLKIVNRDDPYAPITIDEDPTGNVLHRLGVVEVPAVTTSIPGPTVTSGVNALYTLNGVEKESRENDIEAAATGLSLSLHGTGRTELYVNHLSKTGEVYSLMGSRDDLIPKYQDMLFDYMKTFTDSFNRVHYDGFNASGGTHVNFFVPMPDKRGKDPSQDPLLRLAVNELLVEDSGHLATAGLDKEYFAQTGLLRTAGLGDNAAVLELSSLRHKELFEDGSTLQDRYAEIFADIGITAQTAQATKYTQSQIMLNLKNRREQVSGVSLDEEMTNLVKFQHGYSASARMISTVNELLDVLVNQLGR